MTLTNFPADNSKQHSCYRPGYQMQKHHFRSKFKGSLYTAIKHMYIKPSLVSSGLLVANSEPILSSHEQL